MTANQPGVAPGQLWRWSFPGFLPRLYRVEKIGKDGRVELARLGGGGVPAVQMVRSGQWELVEDVKGGGG